MSAFATAAASQQVQGHTGRGSALAHVVSIERALPATAFSLGWSGVLEEGFFLELGHPATARNGDPMPALVMGDGRYVLRDAFGNRGCLYEPANGRGFVRRAQVGYINNTMPLLRRPGAEINSLLVHVDYGMPDHVRPKKGIIPLHSGIDGGTIVSSIRTEALVELGVGEQMFVCYPDGRVTEVTNNEGEARGNTLSPDEALELRLRGLNPATAFLVVSSMIRMTKSQPELRKQIMDCIEVVGGDLNPPARKSLKEALLDVGDTTPYWWLVETEAGLDKPGESPRQCDARLHGDIAAAMKSGSEWMWELACNALKQASKEGQLRPGVQIRFCKQCPPEFSAFSDEVAKLPLAASQERSHGPSPLRGKKVKPSRREQEARRAANRQERIASQPPKGKGGGGGKQHSGNKGGKKNKK